MADKTFEFYNRSMKLFLKKKKNRRVFNSE